MHDNNNNDNDDDGDETTMNQTKPTPTRRSGGHSLTQQGKVSSVSDRIWPGRRSNDD